MARKSKLSGGYPRLDIHDSSKPKPIINATNRLELERKSGEVFIGIPCISSYKTTFQLGPYSFANVKVWGLAWSVKESHMTAGEPVRDVLGSVLPIIILLENEATINRIECIQEHGVLKDVFILKLIHDSLNTPQGALQTMTFPPPCFIVGIWYLGGSKF
ncbi:hypothetical protein AVEN_23657-1 [Araneus ventricosus]|uniref:Uncharacterized protein n=1 Tax=Araneus ventricosus TaxID=182803 RepID=A0A4Y2BI30_ARAVE|nr:hypothetical protein AVEN_23657-1 [Araneus ventricosus]